MVIGWFKKKNTLQKQQEDVDSKKFDESKKSETDEKEALHKAKPDLPAVSLKPEKTKPEIKEETDAVQTIEPPKKTGFFNRLKKGLSKTREILTTDIDELFTGKNKIDDDLLENLEELLIASDIGVKTAMDLIQSISKKASKISNSHELKDILKAEIVLLIKKNISTEKKPVHQPHVIMVVGVNGVGKTTTIGKLAAMYAAQGKKVLIAAADTFRAAAIEQLEIWAERSGADMVKHKDGSDPAAVAYDGVKAAMARGKDVVIVDTAGRLHTKTNLMEEIKKIKRTIAKKIPAAPHEVLLILDATTGQNALSQAKLFDEALGITGLVLTKLDGTAKGGVVVSICNSLKIPIEYIGIGEKIDDLQEFNPNQFVDAMF